MTPEAKTTLAVINRLKQHKYRTQEPIWWCKLHGSPMQRAGIPDLLVVYHGLALFFEIKAPGRKVSPLQMHVMDEIQLAHGRVWVIRSVLELEEALAKTRRPNACG